MTDQRIELSGQTPLPTLEQVEEMWDRHGMLDNIRQHSRVVCQVALTLGDWLARGGGPELSRHALATGALLHDIAKTPCLGTSLRHAEVGRDLLMQEGYPWLAQVSEVHVTLPAGWPLDEVMLVYYADKRVTHDQIVSLESRYEYIMERYGGGQSNLVERISGGLNRALEVERLIFSHTSAEFGPADLAAITSPA